jgi:undecaprenyl-diphosphatase
MDVFMFYFFLGLLQGILEWLPVSSSGNLTLLLVGSSPLTFSEALRVSFFLHAGTMGSVLVKFRSDFSTLFGDALSLHNTPFLRFYGIATLISALVGIPLYVFLHLEISEIAGSLLIAGFLVVTGIIIRIQPKGLKQQKDITGVDAVIVGISQGLAIIPGISRSGMTIASLLYRGIDQKEAMRLSFLLSVPPVCGLMILGFSGFQWIYVISMLVSFLISLCAMEILLKISQTLDFTYFCFFMASVTCIIIIMQVL